VAEKKKSDPKVPLVSEDSYSCVLGAGFSKRVRPRRNKLNIHTHQENQINRQSKSWLNPREKAWQSRKKRGGGGAVLKKRKGPHTIQYLQGANYVTEKPSPYSAEILENLLIMEPCRRKGMVIRVQRKYKVAGPHSQGVGDMEVRRQTRQRGRR